MGSIAPTLSVHRIFRRHLINAFAILVLPIVILKQAGFVSTNMLIDWFLVTLPYWLSWIFLLIGSSALAYFMSIHLIWPSLLHRFNIDLFQEEQEQPTFQDKVRSLFRKWAICWRCLGYWYGGAVSVLVWIYVLPVWYGVFYFVFSGASLGAALTAIWVWRSSSKEEKAFK
ncbi:MAG: hypothetical protein H3C43_03105 [Leptonema sp. (in: Bacteria)]|nr:hypothetical protein [Leptonema sp. (in: bacteria)]